MLSHEGRCNALRGGGRCPRPQLLIDISDSTQWHLGHGHVSVSGRIQVVATRIPATAQLNDAKSPLSVTGLPPLSTVWFTACVSYTRTALGCLKISSESRCFFTSHRHRWVYVRNICIFTIAVYFFHSLFVGKRQTVWLYTHQYLILFQDECNIFRFRVSCVCMNIMRLGKSLYWMETMLAYLLKTVQNPRMIFMCVLFCAAKIHAIPYFVINLCLLLTTWYIDNPMFSEN